MLLRSSEMKGKESAGCKYRSRHMSSSVLHNASSAGSHEGVISQ